MHEYFRQKFSGFKLGISGAYAFDKLADTSCFFLACAITSLCVVEGDFVDD